MALFKDSLIANLKDIPKLNHTSRNGQKSYFSFKCCDLRHIPKVRVFDADFRKVKIKIVDRPVSEIPTHKFWGKI